MAEKEENKINLFVVTPYQYFYEGPVSVVNIPSIDGEIGIMAGHSPLVFALKPGTVTVRVDNEIKHFVVSEGYAEVNREMVLVVCNSAEWAENINIRWIFEAYEEAKKAIEDERASGLTKTHTEDNKHKLSRAQARIHFISTYGSDAQKQRLEQLKETLV